MTKLNPVQRAYEVAKNYHRTLQATDFSSQRTVRIVHEEGTTFWFKSAFLVLWTDPLSLEKTEDEQKELFPYEKDQWIFVYTEHHKHFVYHSTELYDYGQYEQLEIDTISDINEAAKREEQEAEEIKREDEIERFYDEQDEQDEIERQQEEEDEDDDTDRPARGKCGRNRARGREQ